jgi:hypothetical protein
MAMTLVFLVIGFALCAGFALMAFKSARKSWRRYRRIVDTPRSRIGQLRPGFHEVRGRVERPGDPLISPMGKIPCVYYRFVVTEKRTRTKRSGKCKTEWVTVVHDEQERGCFINDGSGRVYVPIKSAERSLRPDTTTSSGFLNSPPDELKAMLAERYGKSTEGLLFNKAMRFEETVVIVDDELYVIGDVEPTADGPAFYASQDDSHEDGNLLLVTDRGEAHLREAARWNAVASALGVVVAVAGITGLCVASRL